MPEIIQPQEGAQTTFLSTSADIAIYGGAAGGGKSWALLLEPLRHVLTNPEFSATIFRRNTVQIRNQGGLWDESVKLYSTIRGAQSISTLLEWKFKGGGRIKFAHLEHEKTVYNYQGSQIPLIGFDELTHFTKLQFFYLLSRSRSMCGVKPYIRATTNPDSESWVRDFISWWIDNAGYAIKERSGVIRWFVVIKDEALWGDSLEDCIAKHGKDLPVDHPRQIKPKSFTFIPATLDDNKKLTEADPGYRANLEALNEVEQARLLGGNWKISYDGVCLFKLDYLLPAPPKPPRCHVVFAVIDSAIKTGQQHDGTAVLYCAMVDKQNMLILDWDIVQIEGSLLEAWLPGVIDYTEHLAKDYCAIYGSKGAFIEDKSSGTILLQQAARRRLKATAISSKLTALGKDERAINVSGYVYRGMVKLSDKAANKTVKYKGENKNHLISQVTSFQIGDKDAAKRADDLLDCFTYAQAIGFGNGDGY